MNVIFSFDDGRHDAFTGYEILKKYGFPGCFHITTGFIDGTYHNQTFKLPLTIEQIIEMHNNNCDISSHGDKHIMSIDDYVLSVAKIHEWIKKERPGFSVPHSNYTKELLLSFLNDAQCPYIRVGRDDRCYSFFAKINYFLYHILHLQLFYNNFNKHNVIKMKTNVYHSVVIKKDCRSKNVINFLKKYKKKNCTIVLMFHSISSIPNDSWDYSLESFEAIVKFCFLSKIIVTKFNEDIIS